ncbi:hypothetical protein [Micromonospora sp. LOL_015]|uniref:hypothetical protein n=1 Tax=Micromonospora sp. LOL_015 TaxID=3345416 RepID=UPI003A8B0276
MLDEPPADALTGGCRMHRHLLNVQVAVRSRDWAAFRASALTVCHARSSPVTRAGSVTSRPSKISSDGRDGVTRHVQARLVALLRPGAVIRPVRHHRPAPPAPPTHPQPREP